MNAVNRIIKIFAFVTLLTLLVTAFPSCAILLAVNKDDSSDEHYEYIPKGEFYVKTPPCHGDTGVSHVVSVEAEYKTYEGEGDITVPVEIGFGHLPDVNDYGDEYEVTFYIVYSVFEYPWSVNNEPIWSKRVDYPDSYYSPKYNSTEQKNSAILIMPIYGEFYPLYKEKVELVFPESRATQGYVEIEFFMIVDGEVGGGRGGMMFDYERNGNKLTLSE